jgi:predicted Rdx family selenoprotein
VFGAFEVSMAGELIYSKKRTGRLPHPGEVENLVLERLHKL